RFKRPLLVHEDKDEIKLNVQFFGLHVFREKDEIRIYPPLLLNHKRVKTVNIPRGYTKMYSHMAIQSCYFCSA
ncbi:MAG: hypothetical protein ABI876_10235, partial [Bacteroidota bacterium]